MTTKPAHPTGLDQSWGYANPQVAADGGIQVVSMYLSRDATKNVTANKVKAYHKATSASVPHGIGIMLNWEGQAGAPLLGANQGKLDATDAAQQIRSLIAGVGYSPKSQLGAVFSCDRDTNSSDYPKTDAYYSATQAIMHAAHFLNGVYGEFDLVNHLVGKKLVEIIWQAYAWSGGQLSPSAGFYQYLNGQHLGGASVDFDQVIHPLKLGVWWPPNHPYNIAPAAPEDDMSAADVAAVKTEILESEKRVKDHFDAQTSKLAHGVPKGFQNSLDAIAEHVGVPQAPKTS